MTVSRCPEHGNLMLDLARGRLDDVRSLDAEAVREACPICARWWNETFSGDAFDLVERAVAESISHFAPPAWRRYRWLAAAAAIILVVGIGATSMMWRNADTSRAHAGDEVSTWDFESGSLDTAAVTVGHASTGSEESSEEAAMFTGDFESGNYSGWSTNS